MTGPPAHSAGSNRHGPTWHTLTRESPFDFLLSLYVVFNKVNIQFCHSELFINFLLPGSIASQGHKRVLRRHSVNEAGLWMHESPDRHA